MQIVIAFLLAAFIALALTPIVIHLSHRHGILKQPGGRHVHAQPMPHVGGIAIVAAVLVVALVMEGFSATMLAYLTGAIIIAGVGLIDDLHPLAARTKLIGQIVAGAAFAFLGGAIANLSNPFGAMLHLGAFGLPLATIWIVAVINAVNLIDGLDGLAAGVTAISAVAMVLVAAYRGEGETALLAAAMVGGALGFLRYNAHPARIIMGDTGSGFLGYTLATLAIIGSVKDTTALTLAAPLVVLALPIFDTGFAILRRVKNRQPIGIPDDYHIHHRLLRKGLGQWRTVLVLYGVTALFAALGVIMADLPALTLLSGLLVVVLAVSLVWAASRYGIIRLPFHAARATKAATAATAEDRQTLGQ